MPADPEPPDERHVFWISEDDADPSSMIDIEADAMGDDEFIVQLESGAFDATYEVRPKHDDTVRLPFTGLRNTHQTCYLNSVLQGIAVSIRTLGSESLAPYGELSQLLYRHLTSLGRGAAVDLSVNRFARYLISYINGAQEAEPPFALEFGRQLDPMDVLPTICEIVDSWCEDDAPFFQICLKSYTREMCMCPEVCEGGDVVPWIEEGEKWTRFLELTCLLQYRGVEVPTVQELVDLEFESTEELFEASHMCDSCNCQVTQRKRVMILENTPRLLVIHIARLEFGDLEVRMRPIAFTGQICLAVDCAEQPSFARYNLCAAVCHEGVDGAGHYVTYTLGDFGMARISDAYIREIETSDIDDLEQRSVLLFYAFDSTCDEKGCERTFIDAFLDQLKVGRGQSKTPQEEIHPSGRHIISDSSSDFDENFDDGDIDDVTGLDESDDSTLEESSETARDIAAQESRRKKDVGGVRG